MKMKFTGAKVKIAVGFFSCFSWGCVAAEAQPVLPNGASSLQETYGNWSVSCAKESERQLCQIAQTQVDKKTQKRIFAFQLTPARGSKASGVLLLPFGLSLPKGVAFEVDENAISKPFAFSTCYPAGCLVPLSLEPTLLKQLQTGTLLKLKVTPAKGDASTVFTVPLDGFDAAYKRGIHLLKN